MARSPITATTRSTTVACAGWLSRADRATPIRAADQGRVRAGKRRRTRGVLARLTERRGSSYMAGMGPRFLAIFVLSLPLLARVARAQSSPPEVAFPPPATAPSGAAPAPAAGASAPEP